MSATPRNHPYTTRAAAGLFAELGRGMRPKGPVTYLEAQWQRVEAQCRLEDALREVNRTGNQIRGVRTH